METLTIRYEKLFSILLVHSGFPEPPTGKNWVGSLADELKISPDGPTVTRFKKHDIHYRFEYNSLSCYIRVTPNNNVPFFRLPTDFSARFLLIATDILTAKTGVSPSLGGEKTHHIRVKLKTTTSSSNLHSAPLTKVTSATPALVFHPGYTDRPSYWEEQPEVITGCLAVLDVVTEGSKKNRLFKQEATQVLNYTKANGKSNEHLCRVNLKA